MRIRAQTLLSAMAMAVLWASGGAWPEQSVWAANALQTGTCNVYPIALSTVTLRNAQPSTVLADIYNGTQPGNFGWLTWAGSPDEPTLVTSLTPPGNSGTYVNPTSPADHQLAPQKTVWGKPGVSNSRGVRDALDVLKTIDIVVPVWNTTFASGSNVQYHIVDFAIVRLTDYRLPSQNRISAIYRGRTDCGLGGGGIE